MTNYTYYIDFDLRDNTLTLDSKPDWENGSPSVVWNGIVKRFYLPAGRVYDESVISSFREEFAGELKELREGWKEVWDGSNWVGHCSENDDNRAYIEHHIEIKLAENENIGTDVWDATDWYLNNMSEKEVADDLGITATTTDAELSQISESTTKKEESDHGIVLDGMDHMCEYLRDEMQELEEE